LFEFSIRRITERDLSAVAEIEAGVFTDWYRVHRRDPHPLAERTLEELRYATSFDPDGNFVAVSEEGAIVGFILSRTWGSVGWFGTFGVPTQFQGLGIGKALVRQAVGYLGSRASVIGLETMPESGSNIGLYWGSGFVLGYPTVILELSLVRAAERFNGFPLDAVAAFGERPPSERRTLLAQMRDIGHSIVPGLDYTPEVEAIDSHSFGETVLSFGPGGELDGFAVLRTAPFRRGDVSGRAYLNILAVRPGRGSESVVLDLLKQVWTLATARGFTKLMTGLSARYQGALGLLFQSGFRGVRAAIRMVRRSTLRELFEPSGHVNVSRWAG